MDAKARQIITDFLLEAGFAPEPVVLEPIPPDGSRRSFWRIRSTQTEQTWIAMANPPHTELARWENYAYLKIGTHLYQQGAPVPQLYRYHLGLGFFLLEDLGPTSLQEAASAAADPLPLYQRVLEVLLHLQVQGPHGFDTTWCCQTEHYDCTVMLTCEAYYFRDAFLSRYLGLQVDRSQLEIGFSHLAHQAQKAGTDFFLHRDFQSRNILVAPDRVGIVDWQGGRMGPLGYDLASLLIDPYTPLTPKQREALYGYYVGLLERHNPIWAETVVSYFPYLAVLRNLQILGAFAYLTQTLRKPHFEEYIPRALGTLRTLLEELPDGELAYLTDLIEGLQLPQKPLDTLQTSR